MNLEKVYTSQISYLFIPLSISLMDTSVTIASEAFTNSDRGHRCLEYPQFKRSTCGLPIVHCMEMGQVTR